MADISVVMPVHDRSEYLQEALLSLVNQTLQDWVAYVVDDYSTEDIRAVVAGMNDSRIIYVRNTGIPGQSSDRNFRNKQVTTRYIAVADSDDCNLPNRLQASLDFLRHNPDVDLLCAGMWRFWTNPLRVKPYDAARPYVREELYENDFIPHPTVVYKTERILDMKYDESLHAAVDYDMLLQFADVHATLAYLPERLVLYRVHQEQISSDPKKSALQSSNAQKIQSAHLPFL